MALWSVGDSVALGFTLFTCVVVSVNADISDLGPKQQNAAVSKRSSIAYHFTTEIMLVEH